MGFEFGLLLDGIHVGAPRADGRILEALLALDHGNGLVWDLLAGYPVDELDVHVAERGLQDHAIAPVRPRRQADDEDLFKLETKRGLVRRPVGRA